MDLAGRKEVAERLQLSANTVRTHLHSLMVKFGVHSTLEVAALARPWLQAPPQIPEARQAAWDGAGELGSR